MTPPIDVRAQTRLPSRRILGLCLKGIRHRLLRSLLTTMVVVLAVAFLMVLLADSIIARSVGFGVAAETRESRRAAVAIDLWTGRPGSAVLAARLASADAPLAAYATLVGWDASRLAALAAACRRERAVTAWLDQLDAGTLAVLTGVDRSDEAFPVLAEDAGWQRFAAEMPRQRALRPPLPLADLHATAIARAATAVELESLAEAWRGGADSIGRELARLSGGADREACLDWIAAADADGRSRFAALLAAHGLGGLYPAASLAGLQDDIRLDRLRDRVSRILLSDEGRSRWLARFGGKAPLEEKLLALADPRAGEVLGGAFPPPDLALVAARVARDRELAAKERELIGRVDPDGALVSARQGFLIAISLVVCMVGIANAMLMAITERFREIATMKCLGATDGFILTQFLMEAGIQGAAGGAAGTLVGLLVAIARGGWTFGFHLAAYFPWLGLLAAGTGCVLAGLLLATLASIYPSWIASRMAPMEAMRVE